MVAPISTPMSNTTSLHCVTSSSALGLVKILTNIVGMKCYPVKVLTCILLLLIILRTILEIFGVFVFAFHETKCLFMSFVSFSIWLFAFFFCIFKNLLLNHILFLQMCVSIVSHFKFLRWSDSIFYIVICSVISTVTQLYSSLLQIVACFFCENFFLNH